MKINKWLLRFGVTVGLILTILLIIILNPMLSYSNVSVVANNKIFHNEKLDQRIGDYSMRSMRLLQKSELYDSKLKLDICLDDGSVYPQIMQYLRGAAFGWGFYNKVVLMGEADYKNDHVILNGYKWNFTQLLTHEIIHCYQFNKFGILHSNPVAGIPDWKWEGYPEYVARQNIDQKDLLKNIARLIKTEQEDNNGWIQFADSTGTVIPYYKSWLLMQYCMDVKHMTYTQVLKDGVKEEEVRTQMMNWYNTNNN